MCNEHKRVLTIILSLAILLLSRNAYSIEKNISTLCEHYNWSKVEALVEPYLDDYLMNALIMQGNSAAYHTAAAADQALGSGRFPIEIETILRNLSAMNCE